MSSGDVPASDLPAANHCPLDPAVVAALYVDHGEELRRFLLGILRDAQLASDVLQATFVKLVERGHETRAESRKAWLFRVAYHEAMAYRRRQGVGDKVLRKIAGHSGTGQYGAGPANSRQTNSNQPYNPNQNLTASQQNAAASAEEPLLRLEAVQSVREALEHLPPEQRQVVRMRIYEEKTFAVIAKELKIPLGTALGRMRAALIKLRARLANPDGDTP